MRMLDKNPLTRVSANELVSICNLGWISAAADVGMDAKLEEGEGEEEEEKKKREEAERRAEEETRKREALEREKRELEERMERMRVEMERNKKREEDEEQRQRDENEKNLEEERRKREAAEREKRELEERIRLLEMGNQHKGEPTAGTQPAPPRSLLSAVQYPYMSSANDCMTICFCFLFYSSYSLLLCNADKTLALLAQGCFGQVFLVQNRNTGKQYAMKQTDFEQRLRPDQKAEYLVLTQFTPLFTSPFIVRLSHTFFDAHYLRLFIDYCGGGSLRQRIMHRKQIRRPFSENVFCLLSANFHFFCLSSFFLASSHDFGPTNSWSGRSS